MIVNSIERSNTIVVLLGGNSPERDISLDSGKNVIDGLTENGLDVIGIDPQNRNWQQQLLQVNPCYIFNILHGPNGEDGLIQGFLETYGFLYSGSNVLGSALGMDKGRSKEIWLYNELPTLEFTRIVNSDDPYIEGVVEKHGLPLCLKTVNGGSSIGVEKVTSLEEFKPAYERLRKLKSEIICEKWMDNIEEYTVGILGKTALPIIQIVPGNDYYDFDAKYKSGSTQYICPTSLSAEDSNYLQILALQAFELIGCSHFGRVDFIRDSNNNFYILEVNTIPGFTKKSLVPMGAKTIGYEFNDLLLFLIPDEIKIELVSLT
jgi:D-alanine-D-alanine ligase